MKIIKADYKDITEIFHIMKQAEKEDEVPGMVCNRGSGLYF